MTLSSNQQRVQQTMKIINLIIALVMISSASSLSPGDLSRRLCLLSGQYYHPGSDSCSDPFNDSLCDDNKWLVPTSVPGELQCQEADEVLANCAELGINDEGEPYCIKEDAATVFRSFEEQILHRQGDCPENMILMVANWMRDTKPCPGNFTCSANYKAAYSFINDDYRKGDIDLARTEKKYAFSSLVCSGSKDTWNTEIKMVCVPDIGSMADNSVLLDSYKPSELICQENPCPPGKWPWLGEDGYQRCLNADTEEIQNCPREHFVVEEDGTLKCQVATRSSYFPYPSNPSNTQVVAPFFTGNFHLCTKNRVYRRGRCAFRFFG